MGLLPQYALFLRQPNADFTRMQHLPGPIFQTNHQASCIINFFRHGKVCFCSLYTFYGFAKHQRIPAVFFHPGTV